MCFIVQHAAATPNSKPKHLSTTLLLISDHGQYILAPFVTRMPCKVYLYCTLTAPQVQEVEVVSASTSSSTPCLWLQLYYCYYCCRFYYYFLQQIFLPPETDNFTQTISGIESNSVSSSCDKVRL
jgi:hypothetical protein